MYFHWWFGLYLIPNVSPSRSGYIRATGSKSFLTSTLRKSHSASGQSTAACDIGRQMFTIWKRLRRREGASVGGRCL
jgi:hypothetical protein